MYGLKLSTDGWITTCPSNEEEDGVLLEPGMTQADVWAAIRPLTEDLSAARFEPDSMHTMLERRRLSIGNELQEANASGVQDSAP
jgi:hypothetical protein